MGAINFTPDELRSTIWNIKKAITDLMAAKIADSSNDWISKKQNEFNNYVDICKNILENNDNTVTDEFKNIVAELSKSGFNNDKITDDINKIDDYVTTYKTIDKIKDFGFYNDEMYSNEQKLYYSDNSIEDLKNIQKSLENFSSPCPDDKKCENIDQNIEDLSNKIHDISVVFLVNNENKYKKESALIKNLNHKLIRLRLSNPIIEGDAKTALMKDLKENVWILGLVNLDNKLTEQEKQDLYYNIKKQYDELSTYINSQKEILKTEFEKDNDFQIKHRLCAEKVNIIKNIQKNVDIYEKFKDKFDTINNINKTLEDLGKHDNKDIDEILKSFKLDNIGMFSDKINELDKNYNEILEIEKILFSDINFINCYLDQLITRIEQTAQKLDENDDVSAKTAKFLNSNIENIKKIKEVVEKESFLDTITLESISTEVEKILTNFTSSNIDNVIKKYNDNIEKLMNISSITEFIELIKKEDEIELLIDDLKKDKNNDENFIDKYEKNLETCKNNRDKTFKTSDISNFLKTNFKDKYKVNCESSLLSFVYYFYNEKSPTEFSENFKNSILVLNQNLDNLKESLKSSKKQSEEELPDNKNTTLDFMSISLEDIITQISNPISKKNIENYSKLFNIPENDNKTPIKPENLDNQQKLINSFFDSYYTSLKMFALKCSNENDTLERTKNNDQEKNIEEDFEQIKKQITDSALLLTIRCFPELLNLYVMSQDKIENLTKDIETFDITRTIIENKKNNVDNNELFDKIKKTLEKQLEFTIKVKIFFFKMFEYFINFFKGVNTKQSRLNQIDMFITEKTTQFKEAANLTNLETPEDNNENKTNTSDKSNMNL